MEKKRNGPECSSIAYFIVRLTREIVTVSSRLRHSVFCVEDKL